MIAGAVLLTLALVVVIEIYLHRLNGTERRLLAEAPAAVQAVSCTSVQDVKPYPGGLDRTHIGTPQARLMPPLSTYPSVPPASGPHDPIPLDAGVYTSPPPIARTIHSLEHAAVIIWYDPSAVGSLGLRQIRDFFQQGNERNHVIVAPYEYPNQGAVGRLPAGRQMALVAWHHVQYCGQPSLPVAFAFVHSYRFNLWQYGAYRGDAPEKFLSI